MFRPMKSRASSYLARPRQTSRRRHVAATLMALAVAFGGTRAAQAFPQSTHPAMKDPKKADLKAPVSFQAQFTTTKGDIVFECYRDWAPHGVDRFYNLVKIGFFHDVALFRVIKGFVVQWGIHGDPAVSRVWQSANLPVDPVKQSNTAGTLTYAMAGSPTTRSTQLFINYGNNARLDGMGFAPICKVLKGMEVANQFHDGYGPKPSSQQGRIQSQGNAFLRADYPQLDYIKTTKVIKEGKATAAPSVQGTSKPKKRTEESGDSNSPIFIAIGAALLAAAMIHFGGRSKGDS